MRPQQWLKNAFVFTGLIFGKQYGNNELLWKVIFTSVAFCLISSAIYIINDIIDAEVDIHHPQKKHRPLPSGQVTLRAAKILSAICCIAGLLIGLDISWGVFAIILCYFILNIFYSIKLKNIVIIDVFCIAAGFMLRILAGTIGVGISPSKWLLLCGLMITLFLGFAKRRAELITLKKNKGNHRKVLDSYSPVLLEEILAICATSVIITYSLYTMSPETMLVHHTTNLLYTVPTVIYGLFRYLYLLHHRHSGGDPSRDLFRDRHIVCAVVSWIALTIFFIT
jgi:4-hydroxybenzoate polyprenyltransferase